MFGESFVYCSNDECAEFATCFEADLPLCSDCAKPDDDSASDDAPSKQQCVSVLNDREISCHGEGGIDAACERLIKEFGSERIDDALLSRIARLTGAPVHPFLRCGLFCAHRSLHVILDAYERGERFYLYTGRGASAGMHLGHLVPFMLTAYLQHTFRVPCIIQLTDDAKFLYKGLALEECAALVQDNVRDILACGFDPEQTYIFSNFQEAGRLYPHVCRIQRQLTCNQVRATFGVEGSDSPGKMAFPAMQMAPALASTFTDALFRGHRLRCLIPCGIDQDPYFRLTRDVAQRLGEHKPAVLQSKFLPALEGTHTKMSAGSTGIALQDSPQQVRDKLSSAFSGGRDTLAEQVALGANLQVDVALQYLHAFAEVAYPNCDGPAAPMRPSRLERKLGSLDIAPGDLQAVDDAYASGKMLSSEVKQMAADAVTCVLARHMQTRSSVTEATVATFMTRRQLRLE